jgi:hypothetical protein
MTTRREFIGIVAGVLLLGVPRPGEAVTGPQLKAALSTAIAALQNLAKPPTPMDDMYTILAAIQQMFEEMKKADKAKSNTQRKAVLRTIKEIAIKLQDDVSSGPIELAVGAAVQGILALAKAEGV